MRYLIKAYVEIWFWAHLKFKVVHIFNTKYSPLYPNLYYLLTEKLLNLTLKNINTTF